MSPNQSPNNPKTHDRNQTTHHTSRCERKVETHERSSHIEPCSLSIPKASSLEMGSRGTPRDRRVARRAPSSQHSSGCLWTARRCGCSRRSTRRSQRSCHRGTSCTRCTRTCRESRPCTSGSPRSCSPCHRAWAASGRARGTAARAARDWDRAWVARWTRCGCRRSCSRLGRSPRSPSATRARTRPPPWAPRPGRRSSSAEACW
mmetsp:Transcript_39231/g.89124  ORF Transcript_39231/g.89124 Transcript_39231/m.89124 type:complete len:204 (-) Transcript_39231:308-919(-)